MKVHYPINSYVSVWIGSVRSEEEFDRCVDGPVAERLGLKTALPSICEVAYKETDITVRTLIEGFSGWKSFVDQAEAAATSMGIMAANAALVCYNVKYDFAPAVWDRLSFLGSFAGQDIS